MKLLGPELRFYLQPSDSQWDGVMRNYWLKIGFWAFAIFAVGMLIVSGSRKARSSVEEIADGTGPITVPLAFVPFEIDGHRAGTLRRLRIFRDSLQEPTRIEVQVSVADSGALEQFAACILAIEAKNDKVQPNDFRCLAAADTAGRDLVRFGDVELRGYPGSYALYAPREHVESVKRNTESTVQAEEARGQAEAESIRVVRIQMADSLREVADSVHQAAVEQAESLRQAAMETADSVRNAAGTPVR